MRSLRPSKCLKTVELTFTTQKTNPCSPKTQNYQFKLKFCTWTNSNMQNHTLPCAILANIFLISHYTPKGSRNKLPNMRNSEKMSHIALDTVQ